MRTALQKLGERDRHPFTATVQRFGWKRGYQGHDRRTVCVTDVKMDGDRPFHVTSHLWFVVGKQMERMNLKPGDRIRFFARVKQYEKGYKGNRWDVPDKPIETDYCLSHPNNFSKLSDGGSSSSQGRFDF